MANETISAGGRMKGYRRVTLILDFLFGLPAIGASVYLILMNKHPIYSKMSIVTVIALIINLFYAVRGYKKTDAAKYQFYMLLSAIAMFILTTGTCAFEENTAGIEFAIYIGLDILSICSYVVLFCAKDLGVVKSLLLSFYNVAYLGFDLTQLDDYGDFIVIYSLFALAIVGFLMVVGKYIDKTERGTK